jgi:sugar phosphate permease
MPAVLQYTGFVVTRMFCMYACIEVLTLHSYNKNVIYIVCSLYFLIYNIFKSLFGYIADKISETYGYKALLSCIYCNIALAILQTFDCPFMGYLAMVILMINAFFNSAGWAEVCTFAVRSYSGQERAKAWVLINLSTILGALIYVTCSESCKYICVDELNFSASTTLLCTAFLTMLVTYKICYKKVNIPPVVSPKPDVKALVGYSKSLFDSINLNVAILFIGSTILDLVYTVFYTALPLLLASSMLNTSLMHNAGRCLVSFSFGTTVSSIVGYMYSDRLRANGNGSFAISLMKLLLFCAVFCTLSLCFLSSMTASAILLILSAGIISQFVQTDKVFSGLLAIELSSSKDSSAQLSSIISFTKSSLNALLFPLIMIFNDEFGITATIQVLMALCVVATILYTIIYIRLDNEKLE